MANGGIVLDLAARTGSEAVRELVAVIPDEVLPPSTTREQLASLILSREDQFSTDLGNGVAFPHVRCQSIQRPVVVFGRSTEGLVFSPMAADPVRLVFLIITHAEQPETQLALLRQLAGLCQKASVRDELKCANSIADIKSVLSGFTRLS
jgi:PTS system fructose-specific IIA component/PTS system nitrogen regulatory IIA component